MWKEIQLLVQIICFLKISYGKTVVWIILWCRAYSHIPYAKAGMQIIYGYTHHRNVKYTPSKHSNHTTLILFRFQITLDLPFPTVPNSLDLRLCSAASCNFCRMFSALFSAVDLSSSPVYLQHKQLW